MPENPLDDINNNFERNHFITQNEMVAAIKKYYDDVIQQISPLISANVNKAAVQKKLDELLSIMVKKTVTKIETAMQASWEISNAKTISFFDEAYKGVKLPVQIENVLKDGRAKALKQFISRKERGLNLSDRVWKTADQFKNLINEKIDEGVFKGNSAYKIGKELRAELQNPATQEKPGKGVYKSPIKNAERLSRTETNMAYRKSDQEAWQNNPLVLGYEIKLSATSKPKARCELCRQLEGEYPVTFVWAGWHPQCLCFKIPILMSRDMLNQYNKLIAQGKDTPSAIAALQKGVRVVNPPNALKDWVLSNYERVAGWKRNPYWWNDNSELIKGILKNVQ